MRGRVSFANESLEDFVIRRGDGSPMFHVANAVDDHDMGITHVIRGEDLLNTTPRGAAGLAGSRSGRAAHLRTSAAAGQRQAPEAGQAPRRRGT